MTLTKQVFLALTVTTFFLSHAQNSDTTYLADQQLKEVTVSARRLPNNTGNIPFAVTTVDTSLLRATRQNLSFKEHLRTVPGVYIQNGYNFAQDARISIRGFGATAAFGIRGIKLIVDGIPETTPDGTGQLDNLNLDVIGGLKVIRGSASSLYGNASGGAILVNSAFDSKKDYVQSTSMLGSFGFFSQAINTGFSLGKTSLTGSFRWFGSEGFRDHNEFKQVNTRLAARHIFNEKLTSTFLFEYVNSPKAQDAGGITLEDSEADFSQARDRNVTFDAGEEINQLKVGTSLAWKWTDNKKLNTYAFFNQRNFDGRLPFEGSGMIELKRDYFGFGNSLNLDFDRHEIKLGYDLLSQSDKRKRFDNLNGEQGDLVLDQKESFLNVGIYFLDYITVDQWYFSGGVRYDFNQLEADDRFLTDGDDSGEININNFSYQIGVGRLISSSMKIFANHSTNFETPTLNQLSNRPDNSGGFEDLKAATASTLELGINWNKGNLNAELVGFRTITEDELVPYELAAFPERTFFRNAGSTLRNGIEFSLNYLTNKWKIYSSYTYSNFEYDDYVTNGDDLSGFSLPGIPVHHAAMTIVANPTSSFEISIPFDYVGSLWADDENATEINNYLEISFSAKYETKLNNLTIAPFVGVRNLTNQQYFDNIRINAFGNRFYEPAPERNYYGGITIRP